MTSHWRGENRITSAPNREISNRESAVAINSIAQQARPIGIGQSEFCRTQFRAASSRVKMTLPSILESWAEVRFSTIPKRTMRIHGCNRKRPQIDTDETQINGCPE